MGFFISGLIPKASAKMLHEPKTFRQTTAVVVYPNPFKDVIHLDVSPAHFTSEVDVKIFDLIGLEVANLSLTEKNALAQYPIKLDFLSPGVYFLNVYTNKKLVAVKKITCLK